MSSVKWTWLAGAAFLLTAVDADAGCLGCRKNKCDPCEAAACGCAAGYAPAAAPCGNACNGGCSTGHSGCNACQSGCGSHGSYSRSYGTSTGTAGYSMTSGYAGHAAGGDPWSTHFPGGFYRAGEGGHYRFPYYSYRRPWYYPGPAVYNRNTNLPW